MSWKDSLLDRLPFYWDGDNIEHFLEVIGGSLDDVEKTTNDIRATRKLLEIEDGEDIAVDQHLDNLAKNVGQTRDVVKFIDDKIDIDVKSENDEMFRRRIWWNIRLQQSDGTLEQIKQLFTEGLKMYRVRTGLGGYVPRDLVQPADFDTDIPPEWEIAEDENMGDRRYVEPNDIFIFHNEEPRLDMEAPDSWHGKFGSLTNYYQIEIPWQAMPWSEGEDAIMWTSQDNFDDPSNPPEDKKHGWSNKYDADRQSNLESVGSIWSAPQEDVHIEPLQKLAEMTRPAATQVGIFGYGGMIWKSQDDFDDPSNPPEDDNHGWGARWDGDVEDTLYAMENLDGFWIDYDGGAE